LQIIFLFIALTWLGKGDFSLSIIASLLSFLVLAILEFVCLGLLMPVFGVTPEILFVDLTKRILIAEPQVLLMFISAFIVNKFLQRRGNKNELFRKY